LVVWRCVKTRRVVWKRNRGTKTLVERFSLRGCRSRNIVDSREQNGRPRRGRASPENPETRPLLFIMGDTAEKKFQIC